MFKFFKPKSLKNILFSVVLICIALNTALAQNSIQAIRIETPPTIDGKVIEEVWNEAFVTDKFYQREPNEGEPLTERTEFLTAYDDNNIYFGIKFWSDPEDVIAKELARDVSLRYDDRIQIILDTYTIKEMLTGFK